MSHRPDHTFEFQSNTHIYTFIYVYQTTFNSQAIADVDGNGLLRTDRTHEEREALSIRNSEWNNTSSWSASVNLFHINKI